jgi:hypothetical protein
MTLTDFYSITALAKKIAVAKSHLAPRTLPL